MANESKLANIANRIHAHLKRFEADKAVNAPRPDRGNITPFYHPQSWRAGARVGIRYVAFQGETCMVKEDAADYLAWLDAGNIGTHYDMENQMEKKRARK